MKSSLIRTLSMKYPLLLTRALCMATTICLTVAMIELQYNLSKKVDEYGNQFRYRAKVKDSKSEQLGRWAWDVVLLTP